MAFIFEPSENCFQKKRFLPTDKNAILRLKRSPAMMLANGARSQSTTDTTNHFDFSNHVSIFTPTTSAIKEVGPLKIVLLAASMYRSLFVDCMQAYFV